MANKPQLAQSPYLHLDAGYTQSFIYDASGNVIYQGWAVPGTAKTAASWRMAKYTYNSSNQVTDIQWAAGDEQFTNIFNNYASLSYS